jgi:hypothetical protein
MGPDRPELQAVSDDNRLGGTSRLGTMLVGRSDEIPDVVLKYEVVERDDVHYVLRRPGDPSTTYGGHVGNFELLGTRLYREREEFRGTDRGRGPNANDEWKRERDRLMDEWDRFPGQRN